ncbi:TIGR04283 family arsenosugar biosynthesis glycosyltransferase [Halanaerobaculum tunisiense]
MSAISVIIPVLNEASTIKDTLEQVNMLAGSKEIIVVDGGSEDNTCQLASQLADKVFETRSGRGYQMNQGAKVATGSILLFLHSDSWLAKEALLGIKQALEDDKIIGGCLNLEIDDDSWPLKFIAWSSNLRAQYLNLMFGDQGIFVRRSVFEELDGYPDIELMEDWEFSRKLAKADGELAVIPHKIYTSARRWHKFGIWKTIFLMHKIKILYMWGVEPKKLKKIYREAR